MSKFIEVHVGGVPRLINVDWIEMVNEDLGGRAIIYLAFADPDTYEGDAIAPDESYKDVKKMIMEVTRNVSIEFCTQDSRRERSGHNVVPL